MPGSKGMLGGPGREGLLGAKVSSLKINILLHDYRGIKDKQVYLELMGCQVLLENKGFLLVFI